MSDYTPTEYDMCEAWKDSTSMLGVDASAAEFDRFINKVKADALREFGKSLIEDADPEIDQRVFDPWDVVQLANRAAQRVEGEA